MITIHLHNLHFHAYHGIHEEEKILGNDYKVNADVQFHEVVEEITSLHESINYVGLYNIIKEEMKIPSLLLESVVMKIGNRIKVQHENIRSINIELKKLHPPISGAQGEVGVSWHKEF